jgi:hypothetical protein
VLHCSHNPHLIPPHPPVLDMEVLRERKEEKPLPTFLSTSGHRAEAYNCILYLTFKLD